jgi:hypothetical protein
MAEKGTFEQALDRQAKSMGALEAAREGIQAVAPGLSLEKMWNDIKHEAVQQAQHGAHELAAAINNGSAFVMYPRGGKDDHGVHGPGQESPGSFEMALDRAASRGSVHGQDKGMER